MKKKLIRLLSPVFKIFRPIYKSEYIEDAKKFLFAKSAQEAGFDKEISKELSEAIWPAVKFGLLSLAGGVFFFLIWGSLAPLDEAAIAPGMVVLSGNHKTIQHRDGGVIKKIHIKDGSEVLEGQVLIELFDTEEKAQVQVLKTQLLMHLAIEARLIAEQDRLSELKFDQEVFDENNADIGKSLELQKKIFDTRHAANKGKIDIVKEKIAKYNDQIIASERQIEANEIQIKTIEEELKSLRELNKKGLTTKLKLNEFENKYQEYLSKQAQLKAQIGNQRQGISEAKLEILSVETDFQQRIADEYKDNHIKLNEIRERYNAAKDKLDRTEIKSPSRGVVTDLQYHTEGGVISPGHKILDVLPNDDELLVEAKVEPKDIDSIIIGLKTKVQLDAYKSRVVPRITGEIVYISADVITEQNTGRSYYVARVKLNQKEIESLKKDIKLHPGMPATAFIVKGERTFLQYLISPIKDSFHKAFKET